MNRMRAFVRGKLQLQIFPASLGAIRNLVIQYEIAIEARDVAYIAYFANALQNG